MQAFKKTFAILSKELNVPIIPVRIEGAYEAMPRGTKRIGKHKITVTYLPVVKPTEEQTYEQLSEKVRNAIIKDDLPA
jgi:long-chain acyl-CoA synthetase